MMTPREPDRDRGLPEGEGERAARDCRKRLASISHHLISRSRRMPDKAPPIASQLFVPGAVPRGSADSAAPDNPKCVERKVSTR